MARRQQRQPAASQDPLPNGDGKTSIQVNERHQLSRVQLNRNSFFLRIPAIIFYAYIFLALTWYYTIRVCPETLWQQGSTCDNDRQECVLANGVTRQSSVEETHVERRQRPTLYDIYHFKELRGEQRLEIQSSESDENNDESVVESESGFCSYPSLVYFTTTFGNIIPSYIIEQKRKMHIEAARKHRQILRHEEVHEVLSHHPVKRAMLAAGTFFHRKILRQGHTNKVSKKSKASPTSVVLAPSALTAHQRALVSELGKRVRKLAEGSPKFDTRVSEVAWGGPQRKDPVKYRQWWSPLGPSKGGVDDGFNILTSYLIVMQWPNDLTQKFPGKMCPDGCPCEKAFLHTVEYREKYQPWLVPPLLHKEGKDGWIYHRGFSKDQHSMIWFRPGHHFVENIEGYMRALLFTLETSVADAYAASEGTVGKYNFVVDCDNFSFGGIPKIADVKKMFTFLQDHFPNRTGVIFIANLAGPAQLFLKMIRPLLHEVSELLLFLNIFL
jgi:hypothetical protein